MPWVVGLWERHLSHFQGEHYFFVWSAKGDGVGRSSANSGVPWMPVRMAEVLHAFIRGGRSYAGATSLIFQRVCCSNSISCFLHITRILHT